MKRMSSCAYVFLIVLLFAHHPAFVFAEETPVDTLRSNLLDLNWSGREVEAITARIGGRALLAGAATESNFREYTNGVAIVHLATHALVDDVRPMHSKLVFSASRDSLEDGYIHTYELYGLSLQNELVVLSACDTGTGKFIRGEGIMSLARAFIYAGVRSVVMSLWPVDDRATSDVMIGFYDNLGKGQTKADALRNAKIKYLKYAEWEKSHPYFWSGFVATGNTRSFDKSEFPAQLNWKMWAALLAFFWAMLAVWRARLVILQRIWGIGEVKRMKSFNRLFILAAVCSLGATWVVAESSENSQADSYFNYGRKLRNKEAKYDSANHYFDLAANLYKSAGAWEKYAACLNQVSSISWRKGNYIKARTYVDSSLKIVSVYLSAKSIEAARSYQIRGTISELTGHFDEAVQDYAKSLELKTELRGPNYIENAYTHYNLGILFQEIGQFSRSRDAYFKAVEILLSSSESHIALGYIYGGLADYYCRVGDFGSALAYENQALRIKSSQLDSGHVSFAYSYASLARIHEGRNEHNEAIEQRKKSLRLLQNLLGNSHRDVAETYTKIARSQMQLDELDEAENNLLRARDIYALTLPKDHPLLAQLYLDLGNIYISLSRKQTAKYYLDKSLRINSAALNSPNALLAQSHLGLADYFKQAAIDDSVEVHFKAALNSIRVEDQGLASGDYIDTHTAIEILSELSNFQLSFAKNEESKWTTLKTIEKMLPLLDRQRSSFRSDDTKFDFIQNVFPRLEDGISLAAESYFTTGKKNSFELAFRFAEKSKSAVLYDNIAANKAKSFANIPDSLRIKEDELRNEYLFYERKIRDEQIKEKEQPDSTKLALWQKKYFSLKTEYDDLIQQFEQNFPDYYSLKYNQSTISIPELQQTVLDSQTALLEYFVGENSAYLFTITRDSKNIYKLQEAGSLREDVQKLRNTINERRHQSYIAAAHSLYQKLVEPANLPNHIKNLIIVPDGILGYIPFDALLTKYVHQDFPNYKVLPYAMNRFRFSHAFTATLYAESLKRERSAYNSIFSGFAPIKFD